MVVPMFLLYPKKSRSNIAERRTVAEVHPASAAGLPRCRASSGSSGTCRSPGSKWWNPARKTMNSWETSWDNCCIWQHMETSWKTNNEDSENSPGSTSHFYGKTMEHSCQNIRTPRRNHQYTGIYCTPISAGKWILVGISCGSVKHMGQSGWGMGKEPPCHGDMILLRNKSPVVCVSIILCSANSHWTHWHGKIPGHLVIKQIKQNDIP